MYHLEDNPVPTDLRSLSDMEILAVIPARGQSRGLERKNLAPLGGRPLLAYTADCVLGAVHPVRAVLSTEDDEIAGLGRRLGLEVPFRRPAELAGDDATSVEVLQHALANSEKLPAAVMLGHLSEERNRPPIARNTVLGILAEAGMADIALHIAPRYEPSEPIHIT